jgi:hypothetical protein
MAAKGVERWLRDMMSDGSNMYTLPTTKSPPFGLKHAISAIKDIPVREAQEQIDAAKGDLSKILSYGLPHDVLYCEYGSRSGFILKAIYRKNMNDTKDTKKRKSRKPSITMNHLIKFIDLKEMYSHTLWRSTKGVSKMVVQTSQDEVILPSRSKPKNTQITVDTVVPEDWSEGTEVKLCNDSRDISVTDKCLLIRSGIEVHESVALVVEQRVFFRGAPWGSWQGVQQITIEFYDGTQSKSSSQRVSADDIHRKW